MGFEIVDGVLKKYTEEDGVTEVVIPDGVTSIGNYAFSRCSNLTSITIPDGVTSIGSWAFENCSSIAIITIPDSVTCIGGSAFKNCSSLAKITIPDSVTSIGSWTFENCSSLTSITIPDNVTSIGDYAFAWCSSLKSIKASENNKNYCDINGVLYNKAGDILIVAPAGISEYEIPNSVTSISYRAFEGCRSLTSVTIPDSVIEIGYNAFEDCNTVIKYLGKIKNWTYNEISKLDLVKGFTELYASGAEFSEDVLKENKKYIKSQRKKLFDKAVASLDMIKYFTAEKMLDFDDVNKLMGLSEGQTEITAMLIEYKEKNFTLKTVEKKENDKFEKELGVKERTLAEWKKIYSFEEIEEGLVITSYKGEEKDIIIPESINNKKVVQIAEYAFSPEQKRLNEEKKSIRKRISSIFIPKSIIRIDEGAFTDCSNLMQIIVDDSNSAFISLDGVLYSKNMDTLMFVPSQINEYSIPIEVKTIWKKVFKNNEYISEIVIPNGVTNIGEETFYGCKSLKNIKISENIKKVGDRAFYGCSSIKDIVFYESLEYVGDEAFFGCSLLENIVFRDGMKKIGKYAFYDCNNLEWIKLPNSLQEIGYCAFYVETTKIIAPLYSYASRYAGEYGIECQII